jgi:hypothetical protein
VFIIVVHNHSLLQLVITFHTLPSSKSTIPVLRLNARGLVQFKSAGHRGAVPCEFKSVPFVCIDETTKQCEIPKPTKEENRKAMEDDKTKSTLVVKSKEGETISTSDKESTEVEREENSKAMEDDKMKSTSTEVAKSKSKLFAYLLWFFLGWAGIHHFYLRRYRQGVLWLTSFGGLFGIGKAANNNPRFLIACLISYSKKMSL